jgi:RNA polymerase primary sigma factor
MGDTQVRIKLSSADDEADRFHSPKDVPESSLNLYMREVNAIPVLSHKQTVAHFRELERKRQHLKQHEHSSWAEQPARRRTLEQEIAKIKELILISNLRLVVFFANRYRGLGVAVEDLVQEGNIGLMRAIDKFDYSRGHRFSTYATWWIRQGILKAVYQSHVIRIPVHMQEKLNRYLRGQDGKSEEADSDEAELEAKARDILDLKEMVRPPVSFDAPITDDGFPFEEVTADGHQPNPEDAIIDETLRDMLRTALARLPRREEVILRLTFGIDLPSSYTLAEVGGFFRLTKERIRQIQTRAIGRLSQAYDTD